uniref:Adenylate kinase 9 n=1 Tax=Poecilia formosa TaxID=48698 RepID=A0A087X4I3_POEFO
MDALVDNLIEDEAERAGLLAKPTCFIIFGRPGVGKSTLARNIAVSYRCILIDATDMLNTYIKTKTQEGIELLNILNEGKSVTNDEVVQLILDRINKPDVQHYECYVLSCLPYVTEDPQEIHDQIELIKNLKLTPDFIINIKCSDIDLVKRLSGLKQHPETGQLHNMNLWQQEEERLRRSKEQEMEDTDEDYEEPEEEPLSMEMFEQMVWLPEYLPQNIFAKISTYKNIVLRQLEDVFAEHNPIYLLELDGNDPPEELYLSVMARLGTMAIKPVPVPVLLSQHVEEELTDTIATEDLLRFMTSIRIVAPGFRWRRSRWGRICPVALKEGNIIQGETDLCVGFQDKLYILSCQDAYQKFIANPRRYLLPPMPRPPCKVCIIGSSQTGKSTMCSLLAQHYGAVVLDLEELIKPFLAKADQERFEKLRDITTPTVKSMRKKKKARENTSGKISYFHIKYYPLSKLCSYIQNITDLMLPLYFLCFCNRHNQIKSKSLNCFKINISKMNLQNKVICHFLQALYILYMYMHVHTHTYVLLSVAMDNPQVTALVQQAIEDAKQMAIPPFEMYVNALKGRMEEIETMNSNSEDKTGWVLDNFPKNLSEMDVVQQVGTLPDTIICLKDTDKHYIMQRIYEQNKESVDKEIEKRLQNQPFLRSETLFKEKEQESETLTDLLAIIEEEEGIMSPCASRTYNSEELKYIDVACPVDTDKINQAVDCHNLNAVLVELPEGMEMDYASIPEMKEYREQIEIFEAEWDQMQSNITVSHFDVEIGRKSPDDLLQEIVKEMERPFQYVAWEFSSVDLIEEEEDQEALTAFENEEEDSDESEEEEEEEEDVLTASKRLLGDTKHFCPVAFKRNNVLWPATDKISAKYRERTYYFSTIEARDSFIENPGHFVAQGELLKPPPLRIFMLGVRGSGKTTNGEWLAKKLKLFHIQFREQLQTKIMAKTYKPVPSADEAVYLKSDTEYVEEQIRAEKGEEEETENTSGNLNIDEQSFKKSQQEVFLTEDELIIKAYLADGEPLTNQVLDMVILPYFREEPYKSVGFILEGFPHDPEQVEFMLERQLFPDLVVVMEVEATDVQRRLLPGYLEKWRMLYHKHEEQIKLLQHLRQKNRDEMIAKRRAELIELQEADESRFTIKENEEEADDFANMEEIDAILEVEFPETGFNEDIEEQETEEAATEWIEEEIEDRFEKDSANIMTVMELISENDIPKLEFNASQKLEKIQNRMLHKINPMITNRESLFLSCQQISYRLAESLLLYSYKLNSAFDCADPVQQYDEDIIHPIHWPLNSSYPLILGPFIYFFRTKENRSKFKLNPLKYLRQPTPTTSFPIKIAVTGPPKAGKTTVSKMFADKYGLARLSIGAAMRLVLNYKAHTNLAVEMKKYLTQGLVVPDELAIQCLEVALLSSVCSIRGYVLDGFPMTLQQTELMESQNIIPILVFELQISTVEVLLRGLSDKMNPNKPYLLHDSSEILHSWDSSYKKEVEHVRPYFQEQHQNWFTLDGSKNKWWMWKNILQQVDISMKCVNSYMKRRYSGKAACINRLCITPKELNSRIGEFGHYCPVCLALFHHLVDCSETADLTHAAEYKKFYYRLCGGNHLEIFLSNPDEFLAPCCPYNLPEPHLLPRKLTELQVKNKFPQQIELKGFCPVTYKDGNQRYESLVRGLMQYAVEYKEKLYIFETKEKQEKFMRTPELYCDQKLPCKVPPLDEPVPPTSLPTLGYLEQGVAEPVIKAVYVAFYLKAKSLIKFYDDKESKCFYYYYCCCVLQAFNQKSTGCLRQKYKKKLASFEENCALITYLSSAMTGAYKPPGERPIDFDFKLNRFLALGAPGATDA